jgi:hypothetical protein
MQTCSQSSAGEASSIQWDQSEKGLIQNLFRTRLIAEYGLDLQFEAPANAERMLARRVLKKCVPLESIGQEGSDG